MKRLLLLGVMLLTACAPQAIAAPVLPPEVSDVSNALVLPVAEALSETTIQDGEGVIQAIERADDCSIKYFIDLGVLIIRDEQQIAHIDGLRALSYFHLTGVVLQPGDIIQWGKVADVQSQALPGVSVAHGWLDASDVTTIFFSWGIPGNESLWRITAGETEWTQLK